LVPVIVIECSVTVAVPVFFRITLCAWLLAASTVFGKTRLVGVRLTVSGGAVPVPLSATACGEPLALSAMWSEAVSAPTAAGLKAMEMVQLAPAATVVPQVVAVWVNDVA